VRHVLDEQFSARRRGLWSADERKDQIRRCFHQALLLASVTLTSLVDLSPLNGTDGLRLHLERNVAVAATGVTVGVGPN
jgi:hypothetical protein